MQAGNMLLLEAPQPIMRAFGWQLPAWIVPRMTIDVASLMTPSPKTTEYSRGERSCDKTCSAATESVAARMDPRARQSYTGRM